MKKLTIISVLLLSGCFSDTSEIKEYIADVQENTNAYIEPMSEITTFKHISYSAESLRSPFVVPKPEAIQEKMQQMSGCLSPDPRRRKQPLEKYSLGDLVMKGTLGELDITWALVEASDGTLHRVAEGGYLGLFNGKITKVDQSKVKVFELIPDGAGCWSERETFVAMDKSEAEGQR